MLAIASSLIKARVRGTYANDSAKAIHVIEGGDLPTLLPAVALHDVGQEREKRTGRDHALIGAEMAEEILTCADFPASAIPGVLQAIRAHRTTGASVPATP